MPDPLHAPGVAVSQWPGSASPATVGSSLVPGAVGSSGRDSSVETTGESRVITSGSGPSASATIWLPVSVPATAGTVRKLRRSSSSSLATPRTSSGTTAVSEAPSTMTLNASSGWAWAASRRPGESVVSAPESAPAVNGAPSANAQTSATARRSQCRAGGDLRLSLGDRAGFTGVTVPTMEPGRVTRRQSGKIALATRPGRLASTLPLGATELN